RRIDVSHVRDPKSLAGQFTDSDAKHDTALVVAILHQLARTSVAIHDNSRDGVGTLVRFRNGKRSLLPAHRAAWVPQSPKKWHWQAPASFSCSPATKTS